jgi:hypothetical protein
LRNRLKLCVQMIVHRLFTSKVELFFFIRNNIKKIQIFNRNRDCFVEDEWWNNQSKINRKGQSLMSIIFFYSNKWLTRKLYLSYIHFIYFCFFSLLLFSFANISAGLFHPSKDEISKAILFSAYLSN